jgi:uncharacterized phage protein (TIGR02218 family)
MSRDITTELKAFFARETGFDCTCCRIIKRDGTIVGLTTVDTPIIYEVSTDLLGEVVYSPLGSFVPTTIKSAAGTGVDSLETTGISRTLMVDKEEIDGQLYDNSRVLIFALDMENLDAKEIILFSGFIGEIDITATGYNFEDRSVSARGKNIVGEVTSPGCRNIFCDSRCKLNIEDFTVEKALTDVIDQTSFSFNGVFVDDYFTYGTITSTSGINSGFIRDIKDHENTGTDNVISIREPFPNIVMIGDTFDIVAGCGKTPSDCRSFANRINFHGEDLLPGNNIIQQIARRPTSD